MRLNELIQRILTSLVLIPLILLLVFYTSDQLFLGITSILILFAAWEWARLIGLKTFKSQFFYLGACLFLMLLINFAMLGLVVLLLGCLWWFLGFFVIKQFPNNKDFWTQPRILQLLGLIVLLPCWAGLVILKAASEDMLFYLLVVIWCTDIMAYLGGYFWGRHKLLPTVSPGKTWEGFAIAMFGSFICALIGSHFFATDLIDKIIFSFFVVIASLAGVIGDLLESMVKRLNGVKDSGSWLPGHGGALDRLDSLTAAVPLFTIGYLFIES